MLRRGGTLSLRSWLVWPLSLAAFLALALARPGVAQTSRPAHGLEVGCREEGASAARRASRPRGDESWTSVADGVNDTVFALAILGADLYVGGQFQEMSDETGTTEVDFIAKWNGKTVKVSGQVGAVCQKKGCWMTLGTGEPGGKSVRISFKDYGFFIPVNSQGADARVEGVLAVKTISAGDVAHLESEGGSFPNKLPDGTAREVRIVATGVELKK